MATEIEVRSESAGLMSVIEKLASSPDVDIDKLQRLLEMQERWQMNQAKAAFRESMAEFKLNPPKIIKDRIAEIKKDGRVVGSYSYADLESISVAITDGLAKVGITHSFKMKQEGLNITVICVLSKGMYSEEGVPLTSAPDTSGAKNSIQAIGSTLSYLEKYTLLGASGMSAGMPDDDANSERKDAKPKDAEPEIRPKSQKGATPPARAQQAQEAAPAPQREAVQGEVVNEPCISPAQAKRYFAIMRSAGGNDEQSAAQLAALGYHGHRDSMPRSIYNAAVDALDPEMKFHTNKPKE